MSSLLRRFKYYGIGFGIGLIFVFFFFRNRGCTWLPSNRVKNAILERVLVLPDSEAGQLEAGGLNQQDLVGVLNDGEIEYSQSRKSSKDLKVYVLTKKIHGKEHTFFYTLPKESFVSEVFVDRKAVEKIRNSKEGAGKLIHFPNYSTIVSSDTTQLMDCQLDYFGFKNGEEVLKALKKTGMIDFNRSDFDAVPKSEHYLEFRTNEGENVACRAIWYKNKINILQFTNVPDSVCRSFKAGDVNN